MSPAHIRCRRVPGPWNIHGSGDYLRSHRADGSRREWLRRLEVADGVFLTGGNQLRLSTTLGGTPVAETLRRRHREGMHIAGTSAGAASGARPAGGNESWWTAVPPPRVLLDFARPLAPAQPTTESATIVTKSIWARWTVLALLTVDRVISSPPFSASCWMGLCARWTVLALLTVTRVISSAPFLLDVGWPSLTSYFVPNCPSFLLAAFVMKVKAPYQAIKIRQVFPMELWPRDILQHVEVRSIRNEDEALIEARLTIS